MSKRCGYYALQCIKQLQHSDETNLYENANTYVNEYVPERNINEKIVMLGMKH